MQLMVDANDDPSTPAYKQIEELVESQVCIDQHVQRSTLLGNEMPLKEHSAGDWRSFHRGDPVTAAVTPLQNACMGMRRARQLMSPTNSRLCVF